MKEEKAYWTCLNKPRRQAKEEKAKWGKTEVEKKKENEQVGEAESCSTPCDVSPQPVQGTPESKPHTCPDRYRGDRGCCFPLSHAGTAASPAPSHLLAAPPVLLQLEASTLLAVAVKKSFLWSELGRRIIQCQLRAEQKESAEKGKSSMRTKRDKVLLRISSSRGNRLGRRRMPPGSRGEREEWGDVRREDLGTEKPNPLTAGRKRGTLKLWRQIFTPRVRVKTDWETCRKKTPGRKNEDCHNWC